MVGINTFSSISSVAALATGPGGVTTAQLATRVFTSAGYELLQGTGERLGLSQGEIDLAHSEFTGSDSLSGYGGNGSVSVDASIRDAGEALTASPHEIRDQQAIMNDILRQTMEQASESSDFQNARGRGRGQGWLMAMAKVLGAQLDKLGAQMESMAGRITKDTPGLSAEFSVVTQQFGMLMNATTNGIKTIGEAMGRAASKQ